MRNLKAAGLNSVSELMIFRTLKGNPHRVDNVIKIADLNGECVGDWDKPNDGTPKKVPRVYVAGACNDPQMESKLRCAGKFDHDGKASTAMIDRRWTNGQCSDPTKSGGARPGPFKVELEILQGLHQVAKELLFDGAGRPIAVTEAPFDKDWDNTFVVGLRSQDFELLFSIVALVDEFKMYACGSISPLPGLLAVHLQGHGRTAPRGTEPLRFEETRWASTTWA